VLTVVPGEAAEMDVTVRNNGSVVDRYDFALVGAPPEWAAFEPPSLSLFPAAEESVHLTVSPVRAPTTEAGPMPFGVRVSSAEDPAGSTVEEGTLVVGAFSDVVAELIPHATRGRLRSRMHLVLDNRSNIPYRARLAGVDPDGFLGITFQPPYGEVEPGAVTFGKVSLRVRSRIWRGPSRSRAFQVQLDEQTAVNAAEAGAAGQPAPTVELVHPPTTLVDGVMLQDAILPAWILKALALLILLVAAAILLWFHLVRPQIQAAAQNDVAKQLAAAGLTATTSPPVTTPPSGGGGGGGGGGGASKGAPTSSGTTVGQTINHSLVVKGNATATYIVPLREVLKVTDVLVQNTAGTNGTVQLSGNSAPLMLWPMADFRDLDYHWITPITFSPLSRVQLTVSGCSGTCVAALYFAGTLTKT
jgi:hypothetical protein